MGHRAALGAGNPTLERYVISVDITSKRYGHPDDGNVVLGRVAFDLNAGDSLAITGPSGVGKSTLLRIVAGLDDEFEGTIDRCDAFSMVFQEPTLLPWRSVIQNLTLLHSEVSTAQAQAMLVEVGLGDKTNDWPQQLSLGQQRRLSLARAFLGQPELLILDEPFVSLDEATHADMLNLTQELLANSGAATLLVTHDVAEAKQLTQRVCELRGNPASLYEVV